MNKKEPGNLSIINIQDSRIRPFRRLYHVIRSKIDGHVSVPEISMHQSLLAASLPYTRLNIKCLKNTVHEKRRENGKVTKLVKIHSPRILVTRLALVTLLSIYIYLWTAYLSPDQNSAPLLHYCIFPLGCRRNSVLYFLLVFPNIDQACEDWKQNPETDSGPGDGIRMKKTEEAEVK